MKEGRTTLSEHESKMLLIEYGIPVNRGLEVANREQFSQAIRKVGFPLAIKACSPHLSHKTDAGLIHLDIRNEEEAFNAFEHISTASQQEGFSVLVQEMIKGNRELVVGMTRDAQFGPCVMFGLGGIFTEILKDVSFRVAPIEKSDALEMMNDIKAHRILEPLRGMPAADTDRLADILIKVGSIGVEQPVIKEIDINPIILNGSLPVAVDALVVLEG
jgi:acetyl-CoA synthetase (ADP-forming)